MWFFTHVWIVPALMALSFLLILFFGKKMPKKGAEIGIFMVSICLLFALATAWNWATWNHDAPEVPADATAAQSLAVEAGALSNVPSNCSKLAAEARDLHGGAATHGESGGTGAGTGDEHGAPAATTGTPTGTGESAAATTSAAAASSAEESEAITRPVVRCATWIDSEQSSITWGTQIDGLSVMMLVVVTLISLLVHVFSTDYVHGDRRYTHYFAFLSLFCFAMLGLVLAGNVFQVFIFWELVGVCSFLLIGFYIERKSASTAANTRRSQVMAGEGVAAAAGGADGSGRIDVLFSSVRPCA